ncbi:aminoglycoside adenylyltransferase domain-containing protein [Spongiactinospora rosea]|nr:aminoglycoside adenylyltransferase domain-containing protein [Spongiactinospora rosea]
MDGTLERYAGEVASAMGAVLGGRLVGVYLHGSAVLGGFDARRSDVDILVVCESPIAADERSAAAEALGDDRLPCPAHGLELSIVTLPVARNPTARPAFELHVTTAPDDTKVVDGHGHEGDPDLVLGFAVCRQAGRLLGPGRPASEVFGRVPGELVLAQLRDELRWGTEHAVGEYAVLNACRAWRFAVDRVLVSKVDGGLWALDRTSVPERELIQTALDRQRCLPAAGLAPAAVQRFVDQVMSRLPEASPTP